MRKPKIYKIQITRGNTIRVGEGTYEDIQKFFEYTLIIANSYDSKVKLEVSNINVFVKNLQKAYAVVEQNISQKSIVELIEE